MEGDPSNQQTDPTTDPTNPAGAKESETTPDYKALYEKALAESRKWEGRSKANKKELDELKNQPAQDRTVEERLAARLITSRFDTAPKPLKDSMFDVDGLITSRFDTAPKRRPSRGSSPRV